MRRLLNSKKGGIPVINEIVIIVMNIIPKPILILLFLLLITTISAFVMPFMLQFFGYECPLDNGVPTLYKVPMNQLVFKTFTVDLPFTMSNLFYSSYQLPDDPFNGTGDKRHARISDVCIGSINIYDNDWFNPQIIGSTNGYNCIATNCPYTRSYGSNTKNGTDYISKYGALSGMFGLSGVGYGCVCTGDGTSRSLPFVDSLDAREKKFWNTCTPYTGYYYNHTEATQIYADSGIWVFTILNDSLLPYIMDDFGDNLMLTRIKDMGGQVVVYNDNTDIVQIQCESLSKPNLYLFNGRILLFDKTMWVYLIVAFVIVGFAFFYWNITLR